MELPCENCGGRLIAQPDYNDEELEDRIWVCEACGEDYTDEELDVIED